MTAPVYLDHNATTPLAPEVLEAMTPFLTDQFANPASPYQAARGPARAVARAREQVAALLGVPPAGVVFTSGGTEAANAAIRDAAIRAGERRVAVASPIEHPCVTEPLAQLAAEGWTVRRLPMDRDGGLEDGAIEATVDASVGLVCVMRANNETGLLLPVDQVAARAREVGARVVCDVAQAAGRIPASMAALGAHYLLVSAHKMEGPKGIGVLALADPDGFDPLIRGGGQQGGLRSGTVPVALVAGQAAAAERARARMADWDRVRRMRDAFEAVATGSIADVRVVHANAARLPNTSGLVVGGVESDALAARLDLEGFCVSTGSACAAGAAEPSATLAGLGWSRAEARGFLRVSLGRDTDKGDLDRFATALKDGIIRLRELPPAR